MPKFTFENIAINSTAKKKPTEQDKDTYIGLEHLDPQCLEVTRFGGDVAPIGEKLLMKKGDVLFGKRRAYQKKVGIAPFDGIFSAHGLVLRPKEEIITKEFFPFFMSSDYFLDKAIEISVGSLSPTINWSDLKKLEFNIPEIDKQKEYAPILWAFNDTKNKYLKLLADLNLLINSQFIEMVGTLKNNKYDFNIVSLGSVADILNGYAFKSKLYEKEGIRVIRITNVQKGFIEDSEPMFYPFEMESEIKRYLLKENDILISLTGNVGRVGMLSQDLLPAALNQRVACIRPKNNNEINLQYLYNILNNDSFENDCVENASGIAQKNMSTDWLSAYKIILPPINIQNKVAKNIELLDKSKFLIQKIQKNIIFLINFLKSNKKYINYAIIKAIKLKGEHYV